MAATCLVAGYALTCDFKERRGTHLLVFIVCTMVFFSDRALAQWPLGYGAAGPISMSESALEEVADQAASSSAARSASTPMFVGCPLQSRLPSFVEWLHLILDTGMPY
eukprot:scaffold244715_cov41-Tisochrysis_lutea.AAC.1